MLFNYFTLKCVRQYSLFKFLKPLVSKYLKYRREYASLILHFFNDVSDLQNDFVNQTWKYLLDLRHHVAAHADLAPRVERNGRIESRNKFWAWWLDSFDG